MLDNVALLNPDGDVVYATAAGAEILIEQLGYTAAPAENPPVAPEEDDGVPVPLVPADPDVPLDPDDPVVTDPAAPRGNASREKWVEYADQLGLQVADEDTREDIKAAVAALEQ